MRFPPNTPDSNINHELDEAAIKSRFAHVVGCLAFCARELETFGYTDLAHLISVNLRLIAATSALDEVASQP